MYSYIMTGINQQFLYTNPLLYEVNVLLLSMCVRMNIGTTKCTNYDSIITITIIGNKTTVNIHCVIVVVQVVQGFEIFDLDACLHHNS